MELKVQVFKNVSVSSFTNLIPQLKIKEDQKLIVKASKVLKKR